MSDTEERKDGLSAFVIDTLLKAVRDNSVGSITVHDANDDITDDLLTMDNGFALGFSNLSQVVGMTISETLVQHFAAKGDISLVNNISTSTIDVIGLTSRKHWLDDTIQKITHTMPQDGSIKQQLLQRSVDHLTKAVDNLNADLQADVKKLGHYDIDINKETAQSLINKVVDKGYGDTIIKHLGHIFNAGNFISLVIADMDKQDPQALLDTSTQWVNWTTSVIGLSNKFINAEALGIVEKIPTLSSKTLAGMAARGVIAGIATDVAFKVGYKFGEEILWGRAFKEVFGKELYDMDWYIEFSDWALPLILQHLKGDDLNAVIAFNTLILGNFVNSTGQNIIAEDTIPFFGSEDYLTMDFDKALYHYKKLYHALSGKDDANAISIAQHMIEHMEKSHPMFREHRGEKLLIPQLAKDVENFIAIAKTETPEGMAYRFAIKHLNPFVLLDMDYTQSNSDGSLFLYNATDPQTYNGMTTQYIEHRGEMLQWLVQYLRTDTDFEDRYQLFGFAPVTMGDHLYQDLSSSLTLDIDGVNPLTLASHHHLFGTDGDDTLQGGKLNDNLFGGVGNDTLIGGKGRDHLEGGTGFDTYHIQGHDTLFDSDAQGKIHFNDTQLPSYFYKLNQNTWQGKDGDHTYLALKQHNHLHIKSLHSGDSLTIQHFFNTAQLTDQGYHALSLTLNDPNAKRDPEPDTIALTANPNYLATIHTAGTSKPTNLTGSQKHDTVFATGDQPTTANLMAGNDLIFGSSQPDRIHGGDGHDVLWGSSFGANLNTRLDNDHDLLIGGDGRDLIAGMAGDDVLFGDETFSHLSEHSLEQTGNWILGGDGNDTLYGGQAQDFLQGGRGADTLFGGAGDDVLLGDGDILFDYRNQSIYLPPSDPHVGVQPIGPTHPFVPPIYAPILTQPTHNTLTIEYRYQNGNWQPENLTSLFYRHPDSFDWSIAIDPSTGDYQLTSKIAPRNADHALAPNEYHPSADDILFGGAGNDLIIGQYGDDFLFGEDGDDILWGDDNRNLEIAGNDWLDGGAGNDILYGGKGDDVLIAGTGSDRLYGGEGFDTYLFALEHLQDGETTLIEDSDNQGRILIDGTDLSQTAWHPLALPENSPYQQGFTNQQGLYLYQQPNGDYLLTSDHFSSQIQIKDNREKNSDALLGMTLATPNQAPLVQIPISDQIVNAEQSFTLALSTDLFQDPDGDPLTLSLTQSDGTPLPTWLSFDPTSNTVTGTAPQSTQLSLKLTATDPKGASVSQTFDLASNTPPTFTTAPETQLFLSTQASTWQYALAPGLVQDADGDDLQHHWTQADGSALPQGLHYEIQTGRLEADPKMVAPGDYVLRLTVNDEHGASISSETTLTVTEKVLKHAKGGLTTGALYDQYIVAEENQAHTINALTGNDIVYGANLNDRVNGGLGDDVLYGLAGDDVLFGELGNDTLIGGLGNDYLNGGLGDDTYVFHRGDGQDRIYDIGGNDTLKLPDIRLSDLLLNKEGNDLLVRFRDEEGQTTTDSIRIENWDMWLFGKPFVIESWQLKDATLSHEQVVGLLG